MGIDIDLEANNMRGEEKNYFYSNSKIKVWVIPTNEELMIAKETVRLIKRIKTLKKIVTKFRLI